MLPAVQIIATPEAKTTMQLNDNYFDSLVNRMILGATARYCMLASCLD